ncbi:MAG: hypothetical protein K2M03_02210 [Muribaculaceae bacterium]|nr:hypothetical protein [Muribaculaceae bacterium]
MGALAVLSALMVLLAVLLTLPLSAATAQKNRYGIAQYRFFKHGLTWPAYFAAAESRDKIMYQYSTKHFLTHGDG